MTEKVFRERRAILSDKLAEAQQRYDQMGQRRLRLITDQNRLLQIQKNRHSLNDWTDEERRFVSSALSKF